jgi:hypothetical protein
MQALERNTVAPGTTIERKLLDLLISMPPYSVSPISITKQQVDDKPIANIQICGARRLCFKNKLTRKAVAFTINRSFCVS